MVGLGYVMRRCSLAEVQALCKSFHGYGGAGGSATYTFGVYEDARIVAAYAWQPPPTGSALSVCATAPAGVLSLSRMVAVPRADRVLNHVSRPLRQQMKHGINRARWPVLVTYSDEGEGHTGHVYKCSGWKPTHRATYPIYTDASGKRTSSYRNGQSNHTGLTQCGETTIQRWEHWIDADPAAWMARHGWQRVAVPGKTWANGKQAHTWRRQSGQVDMFA
jgi:hypothetical protein